MDNQDIIQQTEQVQRKINPLENMPIGYENNNSYSHNLKGRLGYVSTPYYIPNSVSNINLMKTRLGFSGGRAQQNRMIRDKRRSLDKAVLYSYQGAFVKKVIPDDIEVMEGVREQPPVRALINANKLKQDYDDKIISIGFEHDFKAGDVFEWVNTDTKWLIYLQDLTELAYFRGDIRRCTQEIAWEDEDGVHKTFAAVRGPVETKIDYIQKHGISVDNPNYSLNILMPYNDYTIKYFKRYDKFYLQNDVHKVCWRVEAIDWISMQGIIEVNATEYYANETEDDIENGIVGGLKVKQINPNSDRVEELIKGDTFIKPKVEYTYKYVGLKEGKWSITKDVPVEYKANDKILTVKWLNSYHGQFDIKYGDFTKTIVVESLF